jgi:hypothetical protein
VHAQINPVHVKEAERQAKGVQTIQKYTACLLQVVLSNVDMIPPEVRAICRLLVASVATKFPGHERSMLSGE